MLFKEIEATLQVKLESVLTESAKATSNSINNKEKIISEVTAEDDVLFYWSLCSVDIINEQHLSELLTRIVELWLTICGFSLAKEWLEKFKWEKHVSSSKSKGLRKTLKTAWDKRIDHGISRDDEDGTPKHLHALLDD